MLLVVLLFLPLFYSNVSNISIAQVFEISNIPICNWRVCLSLQRISFSQVYDDLSLDKENFGYDQQFRLREASSVSSLSSSGSVNANLDSSNVSTVTRRKVARYGIPFSLKGPVTDILLKGSLKFFCRLFFENYPQNGLVIVKLNPYHDFHTQYLTQVVNCAHHFKLSVLLMLSATERFTHKGVARNSDQ